ncbi:MAG: DUF1501 domain-containing protein [Proteobacteria bacterium]|nr:DUF1501 domain-containing protein [Pseudomonadota bacterium]
MNRRDFIKSVGVTASALAFSPFLGQKSIQAALPQGIQYIAPSTLPKIINIFLYGGPSELSGNLTNIDEINFNSQNSYPSYMLPGSASNVVTTNGFWGLDSNNSNSAGGDVMERLLASGDMSIYRTINRIKDNNRGHGRSVTQNLVGNIDPSGAGIASTLSAILAENNPFGKSLEDLILPVVSFEGESIVFKTGDLTIPLSLKDVALDQNFRNPYDRSHNGYVDGTGLVQNSDKLETLARSVSTAFGEGHGKINNSFSKRSELADFIAASFSSSIIDSNLPEDPPGTPIVYPDTNFGNRLKAAVSLAINNPDTFFISLGSGGLGGWDDHSGALEDYPPRFNELMEALEIASKHMNLTGNDNIAINVYGDFGRNVNLNNAEGWDHGTNQNFYTVGGSGIAGRTLGKLVGTTERVGTPFENRQFTLPTSDSYQCEPFSIAATIYSYFGVQNPELLAGEPAIDETTPPNELV